jgi:hypothetical protein
MNKKLIAFTLSAIMLSVSSSIAQQGESTASVSWFPGRHGTRSLPDSEMD